VVRPDDAKSERLAIVVEQSGDRPETTEPAKA
jgi:hypothetical protein